MKEFLFLLSRGHMRAYCHPGKPERQSPLNYEGRSCMPCASAEALREFIGYMFKNYSNGTAVRISFVCDELSGLSLAAGALGGEWSPPPPALYFLPYLLPQLCRKMEFASATFIAFAGQVWKVDGTTVHSCSEQGRCPIELSEDHLARLFFAPEPYVASPVAEAAEAAASMSPISELASYVEGSRVQPKPSVPGGGRHG